MRTKAPAVLPLFRSELQARLLAALLLGDTDVALGSRELAERTGATGSSLHRELQRLERAGLIEHESVGRAKLFRAASDSPLHQPLRDLLRRTLGVEPELRRRLGALEGLDSAAIFGSWAANRVTPHSDIDVLVVGNVDRDALLDAVRPVERLAGREISVTAYRPKEFARRRRDGSGFLATILSRPLIPLVGQLPGNATST